MARLRPSPQGRRLFGLGDRAEIAVLDRLCEGLSDAYTVYHSVEWTDLTDDHERHGEIDIIVVNQAGNLVAIEVKSGSIRVGADGIFKAYAGGRRDVTGQLNIQHSALRARLNGAGLTVRLRHFLVLTDARVQSESIRWPRERILDSAQWQDLPARIAAELGPGYPDPVCARVLDFLDDGFCVRPDVSTPTGRPTDTSRRQSVGLADWVPRIVAPSRVVRVVGTAGSGKTQLALHLLREANRRGQRAGYLCFNRALADHIGHHVPVQVSAQTFHQWADRLVRQAGGRLDYRHAGAHEQLVRLASPIIAATPPSLDLLVLDELQDFMPEWAELAVQRMKPDGRLYLLEDPEQQLYDDRQPFDVADEVIVFSNENFRSPRSIIELSNLLGLTRQPIEALGAYEGTAPDPFIYGEGTRVESATLQAVRRCLAGGIGVADIAVVSLLPREASRLCDLDRLGEFRIRRYAGHYDENGEPVWHDGDLLIDSIDRFKGQSAQAVVLTECDFDRWTPALRRRLFVALTRAMVRVEWVLSERAAQTIAAVVEGAPDRTHSEDANREDANRDGGTGLSARATGATDTVTGPVPDPQQPTSGSRQVQPAKVTSS